MRKRRRIPKAPAVAAVAVIAAVVIGVVVNHQGAPTTTAAKVDPITTAPSTGASTPSAEGAVVRSGEGGDTYYAARLSCPGGAQVSSASTTVIAKGATTEVPMAFEGSDVWLADLTSFGFKNSEPDLTAHGTCGGSTPAPQQEQLHLAELPVEVQPNPDGTLTTLQVRAKRDNPNQHVCPLNAPVRSEFWVHGFAPSDDPTSFVGGWEVAKLPGMQTTELTEMGPDLFGTTVDAASYTQESSRTVEGKAYTDAWYGYCDFARTPPA